MSSSRLFLLLFAVPLSGKAANWITVPGTSYNFWTIVANAITALAGAIGFVATAMFVVGAFLVTIGGVKEEYKTTGKNLIIGSVSSLAVVLGAYAMLRMVDYFLN